VLERSEKTGGLERNKELTEKLITGVSVQRATVVDGAHSRNVTVKFTDFDPLHPDKNEFLAINQFRIDYIGRVGFVIPDVLLFVNGIPLVIIECKSQALQKPTTAASGNRLNQESTRCFAMQIHEVKLSWMKGWSSFFTGISLWCHAATMRLASAHIRRITNIMPSGKIPPLTQMTDLVNIWIFKFVTICN